jgi:GAF domain-containing protein
MTTTATDVTKRGRGAPAAPRRDSGGTQRRLAEATRLLASSLDLRQVLDRFATIALELMAADLVGILLAEGGERCLTLASLAGTRRPDADVAADAVRDKGLTGCILSSGRPLQVADVQHDARVFNRAWFDVQGVRSYLGVPLLVNGAAIGVMACMTRTRRTWSADDIEYGEALATAAAVAIRNARLHGETQERLARLRGLTALDHVATSAEDLQRVLERVVETSVALLGAEVARIWVVDPPAARIRLTAARSRDPEDVLDGPTDLPLDDAFVAGVLASRGPRSSPIIFEDPLQADTKWVRAGGYAHRLSLPLAAGDRALGALAVLTRAPHRFTAEEVELLTLLAAKAATALQNAQLHADTRQRLEQNETLLAVARAANSTLDLTEVMRRVARAIGRALGADMVGAYLADADQRRLRPVAGYHVPRELLARFLEFPLDIAKYSYVEEGWRSRQPAWCTDAQVEGCSDPDLVSWAPIRSIIFFPLVVKDEPIGALFLIWWAPRAVPTPEELRLLEAIAGQTALAIGNARLFEARTRDAHELARRLRETEALLGVAESLAHVRDIGEIMRRVCREAARALGADSGVFYVIDESTDHVVPAAGYHVPKAALAEARPVPLDEIPEPLLEARQTRETLFVADLQSDPRFSHSVIKTVGVRSLLASPVFLQDRLFGDVLLYWFDEGHVAGESDQALLGAICAQAALALENARLLAETRSQAGALREKNAELDSFVYTVSHDLKAPLVTIQGMSSLVLEDYAEKLDEDGKHYLHRIAANTQTMERLILDLLALSRIGREAHAPEEVPLGALVGEVLEDLGEPLRAAGITVTVGALPSVWAVRVQMEQVVRNLLTNALKYMGDAPAPAIEIGAVARGAEVEIWVKDTGIGIDPQYHDKVFEIFQRLKDVEAEGSGVGLPIVKKIVHGAGGRIWVESAKGQGSTFRFTWPAGPRR